MIACIINIFFAAGNVEEGLLAEKNGFLYCKKYARRTDFVGISEYLLLELYDQLLLSLLAELENKMLNSKIKQLVFPHEKRCFVLSEINDHFIIFLYKSSTKTQS